MRKTILFLFLLFHHSAFSQVGITGTVRDGVTKKPLSYCAVAIRKSNKGVIANEDGDFKIIISEVSDTLLFSFIGYKRKEVPATELLKNPLVELDPLQFNLNEVVVHGKNSDYLYLLIEQCRKKITSSEKQVSKVYFQMQTDVHDVPAEILECYYNAEASGHALHQLSLKNGRIGLAETPDHSFFLNENTALVLPKMDLVKEREGLPEIPFQMNERQLKKVYSVSRDFNLEGENTIHIKFNPTKDWGKYFRGEAWIDRITFDLLRIELTIDSAVTYPFVPVWHEDALKNVSLTFSETFSVKDDCVIFPEHIIFGYNLSYHSNMAYRANEMLTQGNADTSERIQQVHTSGSMIFYDYKNSFQLPHYNYDEDATDYRKILSFPFNENFWTDAPHLIYTERQNRAIDFFNENGVLVNYQPNAAMHKVSQAAGEFFAGANICWSDTQRISLNQTGLKSELRKESLSKSLTFRIDQYHLETQIFIDMNSRGDSVSHFSASVFDVNKSFYNLPSEPFTDCFLNLYFDIAESERRKMETQLKSNSYSTEEMDSVFTITLNNLKQQQDLFIKETESGLNAKGLSKWNDYIVDNLGIDNLKIFGLK